MSTLQEYFVLLTTDYTVRTITIGTAALGAICGILGSFAVLKRQSLLGDAISHATLPGIAIAFLMTKTKGTEILLTGALISGLIGAAWIYGITKRTHLKTDTALGIILSVFFGFGMLLLTFIQKIPDANQAGLDKFLFGQAATLVQDDINILLLVLGVTLIVVFLFWKEFKLVVFDSDYTETLGFKTRFLDLLLTFFIVLAIVLGLQTVGVILMSAMLLAPAAAARQWTNRLSNMLIIASLFGAVSGVLGTAISASYTNLSTGPVIVLFAIFFVSVSFIFAPNRGLLARQILFIRNRKTLKVQNALMQMYKIARTHAQTSHPHHVKLLNSFQGYSSGAIKKLTKKGWVETSGKMWWLTEVGYSHAQKIFENQKDWDDSFSD